VGSGWGGGKESWRCGMDLAALDGEGEVMVRFPSAENRVW
jgi:hypothetical protein